MSNLSNQAETTTTQQRWISNRHIDNKWLAKLTNAEERGIPCNFSVTEFKHMWKISQPVCDLSGEPLVAEGGLPNSATLDRIDNRLGYLSSNCCIVSYRINQYKNSLLEATNTKSIKVTKEDRQYIKAMFESLNNEEYMKELKEKYIMKDTNNVEDNALVKETLKTPSKSNTDALPEVFVVNGDVSLSRDYAALGVLVGSLTNFTLSFNEYKQLHRRNKCMITGRKINDEKKVLWCVDKSKDYSKDNVLLTTETIQQNMDRFSANCNLSLTEWKNLAIVLGSK